MQRTNQTVFNAERAINRGWKSSHISYRVLLLKFSVAVSLTRKARFVSESCSFSTVLLLAHSIVRWHTYAKCVGSKGVEWV